MAEQAGQLPTASEACFSLEDHLACVERRLELRCAGSATRHRAGTGGDRVCAA